MIHYRHALSIAAAMSLLGGISAQAAVPITPGDYVRDGVQCRDAPFAALLKFDGKAFSGVHESDCATTVISRTGRRYALKSTCRAAGDGKPQTPYTEIQNVTVLSPTRITFSHKAATGKIDSADYRLCPASSQ